MKEKILKILDEEMVLAEGCTEPISVALAAATAVHHLDGEVNRLQLKASGNIIKNVDGVVVPNSGGLVGLEASVLIGAFYGNHEKDLLVISDVSNEQAKELNDKYYGKGLVKISRANHPEKLYLELTAFSDECEVSVEIIYTHNNITKIMKNGINIAKVLGCNDANETPLSDRTFLTVKNIWDFATKEELSKEITDRLDLAIEKNTAIADEGTKNKWGLGVGKTLHDASEIGLASKDVRTLVPAYAAAGSDARMSGSPMPVMSVSGSGNQGMTTTLGVIKFAELKNIDKDTLHRALLISILTTVHIKTNIGRLSPFCGVVVAGAASSVAFMYMLGESFEKAANALIITLGDTSGIICDGAKPSCASKIASSLTAGVDATIQALDNSKLGNVGLVTKDVERTIKQVSKFAAEGMTQADEKVFEIMLNRDEQ